MMLCNDSSGLDIAHVRSSRVACDDPYDSIFKNGQVCLAIDYLLHP